MPSNKNRVVIASAGSRKTTLLVEEALTSNQQRVLITTYTNENLDQIRAYLISKCGHIPKHITLLSWYSFLLQDGVRPYQNFVAAGARVSAILFEQKPQSLQYVQKSKVEKYFFSRSGYIYRDTVSDFVCLCDKQSNGLVISRLQRVYDRILIDEVQDLAGYDLELLERLFASTIQILVVGDPRQGTFSTNNSSKNKRFKRDGILGWFREQEKLAVVMMEERNDCYRGNQAICDFADKLFPHFAGSHSKNTMTTSHDGVFEITRVEMAEYYQAHKPVILRWNKTIDTMGLPAINFGASKGRTYERVMIMCTKPIAAYLKTRDLTKAGDISKLYVAVTRARYSVAFILPG